MPTNNDNKQDRPEKASKRPPGEVRRDEARAGDGPKYGGEGWASADQRGPDERFGENRADDSDPSVLKPSEADADAELAAAADGEIEASGVRAGMSRGEPPRIGPYRNHK